MATPVERGEKQEPLEPLIEWLDARGEADFHRLTDSLLERVPQLTKGGGNRPQLARTSVLSHLPRLRAVFCGDFSPEEVTLSPPLQRFLKEAARDGVELTAVLRSFEYGHSDIWGWVTGVVRDATDEGRSEAEQAQWRLETLEQASMRMFDYFQAVSALVVTTYTRELARIERRAASRRNEQVAAVLSGALEEAEAERELGYLMGGAHVAYVAWVDDVSDIDRLDAMVVSLREAVEAWQHISIPSGERGIHGWFAVREGDWRDSVRRLELDDGLGLAIGAPHSGINGFRASHHEANHARRVGDVIGASSAVFYEEVAVAALSSRDTDLAHSFVDREIGPLLGDDPTQERLLETLRVYLAELGSPTRAGRRLHVHTNTVVKRLDRIEELLGHPIEPTSLSLRVALELAPLLREKLA